MGMFSKEDAFVCNVGGETNQAKNVTAQEEIQGDDIEDVNDHKLANLYSEEDEAKSIHAQGEVDDCEHVKDDDEIRTVENDNEDADDEDEIREVEDDNEEAKSITARGEIEEDNFEDAEENDDKKKAIKFLKPQPNKDSHLVTIFVGIFVALFCVYSILAHSGIFSIIRGKDYMEAVYPVFSMFALLSLHMFCYGCNLFTWKGTGINYNFIFNFQPNTVLKHIDAFLICTCMMTTVVSAMVLHLLLGSIWPHKADFISAILLLSFVAMLICPLNIFYRPTRYCFLRVMRNIICSPFYKVLMVDVFMADQLTSQIPFLRHMESTACYFVARSLKKHMYSTCKSGKLYRELAYVISFAPYYWRAVQCARRLFDEGDTSHLANMGKYVSTLVAAGARITYARQPTPIWMTIALVTSVLSTVYQLYWDFVKDWGLLHPKSKNPWLRNELVLKKKGFYFIAIALNFILRVAWVESVLQLNVGLFKSRLLDFIPASLEIIRRGHWNYYRLENEHLHNVGKYSAVKMVPLPFRETDSDG